MRGRRVRWEIPKNPMNTNPSRMITIPKMRVRMFAYCSSRNPNVPPRIVTVTNTTVNPPMNNATPTSSRLRSPAVVLAPAADVDVGLWALAAPPR